MSAWCATVTVEGHKFLIADEADDPVEGYRQMVVDAREKCADDGLPTHASSHALTALDGVIIETRALLDTSKPARIVADELFATFRRLRAGHTPAHGMRQRATTRLAASWANIVDVLSAHGVEPAAPSNASWVADMGEWYPGEALAEPSVRFWFDRGCWRYPDLLPTTMLVDPAESVEISRMWTTMDEAVDLDPDEHGGTRVDFAGGPSERYDNRFVVIADLDGVTFVIDTREGPARGCVSEYSGAFIDSGSVRWSSLGDMMAELDLALSTGALFDERWAVGVEHGKIVWD